MLIEGRVAARMVDREREERLYIGLDHQVLRLTGMAPNSHPRSRSVVVALRIFAGPDIPAPTGKPGGIGRAPG